MKYIKKYRVYAWWVFLSLAGYQVAGAENLYQAHVFESLTGDKEAHRVGDVITVLVLQNTAAKSSADLSTGKRFNLTGQAALDTRSHNASIGIGANDEGRGQTSRGGNIKAMLTVMITAIDANGQYEIKGHQTILINKEEQTITLSGIIRGIDISPNNTILSSQIGNAEIHYTGEGALTSAQRHGLIYRIFSFLGLI